MAPSLTRSYSTRLLSVGAAKSAVYHDCPCTLNELTTAITAYIRNIIQAGLQKVFANKIKWVQACIDAHGHHFQHLLEVHSDFLNTLYKCDRNVYRMMGNVSSICCKFHMLQI
jgi:hypothetical protein